MVEPVADKKKNKYKVEDVGKMGRELYNQLVVGIETLKPTSGRIFIEVQLEIQDDHIFKDDETRSSKLIIEVFLENKNE